MPEELGLYIEYKFTMEPLEIQLAGLLCSVLVIVLLWKFATDSWSIGAAFGSLVVALINLTLQWNKTAPEKKTKSTKKD